jgi:hypothetical protein
MHYMKRFQFVVLLFPLMLSACGKKGDLQVTAVDISTTQVEQRTYLNFEALVKIGNLKFPNVEVPILNPATMTSFGQMALLSQADGTNKMMVSIDFETATRLNPVLGNSLPNGREIPISLGAQNTALVGIPILQNSRIYVGGDLRGTVFLGAAVAIPAFDNIMNQVSIPLNIFTAFPFSPTVTGVAGIFTSPSPGQNGLALFVKKTPQTGTSSILRLARESATQAPAATSVAADPATPTEINELNYYTRYRLNRLFNRNATLKIK